MIPKSHRPGKRILFVDSETTGLNPVDDKLLCVQVWEGKSGKLYEPNRMSKSELKQMKKDFEDPNVLKVIQHAAFDIPMIYCQLGILIRNVWDTKLMEAIILGVGSIGEMRIKKELEVAFRKKYSTSLDYTLERRGIVKLDKSTRQTFIGHTGPLTKDQIKYAIDDVKWMVPLYKQQVTDIERLNLQAVAWLENECVEVTAQMKINGIGFDEQKWLNIERDFIKKSEETLKDLPSHINWKSPAQLKKFFARKGILIQSVEDLPSMINKHPLIKKIIDTRQFISYVSKYGSGWLWKDDKETIPTIDSDGRVRCSFEQVVSTGRYSCYQPNLQQIPDLQKTKHRECFIPRKGFVFNIGDFTGQELGIMAAGAGEQSWIDAMLNKHDVHSVMGAMLYGAEWQFAAQGDCTFPFRCNCLDHKPLRRNAKDLNFGLAYGKGPRALAVDLNLEEDVAFKLINEYKRKIPKITKWLRMNGQYAANFKETFTLEPFKRRRSLELEPEEWRRINQGKNTPVQGTGGDILKLTLVNMWHYIRDNDLQDTVKVVLVIHDEIICEVKKGFSKRWLKIMKQIMEDSAYEILNHRVISAEPFEASCWLKESVKNSN